MSPGRIILAVILSGVLAYGLYDWAAPPETLFIEVASSGEILLNGKAATDEELFTTIQEAVNDDPRTIVRISAHPDLPAGAVVAVAQEAERAGALVKLEARLLP